MKRIVHLGLGNFHRAHQAWYTANLSDWTITGVVMTNRDLFDQLAQHGGAFNLGIWDQSGLSHQVISVYDDVFLAGSDARKIIARIADADTHIVTLTVTEKGYCLRANGTGLDDGAQAIARDLRADLPQSAIGILAAGLAERAARDGAGITILSCDNLADNSDKLRQVLLDYLALKAPFAIDWLRANTRFPNTMVDRITPRLSAQANDEIAALAPVKDLSIVGTEAFSEWIIEDAFAGPRPDWNKGGALFVNDVSSFEKRKLRLLNAAHSYLAYAGLRAGHRFVHEAIGDPELRKGVNALWDEAAPSVPAPASASLHGYRKALIDRFAVPALRHELAQIAMDGSMKMRERLRPIVKECQSSGRPCPQAQRAIGAWLEFLRDQSAEDQPLQDPNAERIAQILKSDTSIADQNAALLDLIGAQ